MFRSRFLWRLYAGYVVLIFLSTAIVGGLIIRKSYHDSLAETARTIKARAIMLEDMINHSSKNPDELQKRVLALGKKTGTRLTVINANGVVMADSREKPENMDNHAGRPEVMAALSRGFGTVTRFSDTLGVTMMYYAIPVNNDGLKYGFVRTSVSLISINKRLANNRNTVILGAGVSVFVALLLGFFIARSFARPLSSITEVAESIADGDYSKRLPTTGKDEIGKLAQAFNRMAESSLLRMESIDTDRNNLLAVLSGMIEGVVAVDKQERVVHINEAAEGILGITAASSVGKPLWEVTRLVDVCQTVSGTLRNASEITKELRIPGSPADRVVEIQSSPIRDSEGNLAGAVVVLHDISELERLETMRRDFIANVSHELKTPITAIRGLVETLISDRRMEPEKHERFLQKIANQSMRLSSIVTDLLTISRLESGKILERKLFDLRRAIVNPVHSLTATGENRGVKMEMDIPDDPVSIVGDEESLCEAVNNLLDNGLKYSREGGDVFVRLYRKEETVVIEVEDTGAGIEKRDQQRIFERFYRVDKARSRELGGTGLGLSIVKHIAISHGGSVFVESAPGQGSTFRIVLPLVQT